MTVRIGVIGLGVGEQHVASYTRLPTCEVRAVCDLDPKKLHEVGDRYDVATRATDYRKITRSKDIDAVSICSYDDVHAEQCISALRNGKHVMVEKPLTLHRSSAAQIFDAQQESGRILTSNLILRASPRFRELKRRMVAGEFGDVFYMEGDYIHSILHKLTEGWRGRMPFYSVTYGGGIHLIDLMRWLLGFEIEEVCGFGTNMLTKETAYRFDDTTIHAYRFSNGTLAKGLTTLGPKHPKLHRLDVFGSRATFRNHLDHAEIFRSADARPERITTPHPAETKGELIQDFVEAIIGSRMPTVTPTDVFRVMDVCFAAQQSITEKRSIKVDYLV